MEWLPRGLPSIHAPIPICGESLVKSFQKVALLYGIWIQLLAEDRFTVAYGKGFYTNILFYNIVHTRMKEENSLV